MKMIKWFMLSASLVLCVGMSATQALAGIGVDTKGNNFSMIQPGGVTMGGTNDVRFTWDGTTRTSVAVSGQVSNATLSSPSTFNGFTWVAHDVVIYGPGTSYAVFDGCPAGSPGCGIGNEVDFTVGPNELGAHMLFDWGAAAATTCGRTNCNIDVVNVWTKNAVFGTSTMWTAGGGSAGTVWNLMSKDVDGDGDNGLAMSDGAFTGFAANFNVMGIPYDTTNNNFTMTPASGTAPMGGTNDVHFSWNGTEKTAVAVSGQVPNATIESSQPFFGAGWTAHDVAIYGPGGPYTVYADCTAGNPGCGTGTAITFTVGANELGGHILFNYGPSTDIDVVNVWTKNAAFGPSTMLKGDENNPGQDAGHGYNAASTVWDLMSKSVAGNGKNGLTLVDGPFAGVANPNFNLQLTEKLTTNPAACGTPDLCADYLTRCNDQNACHRHDCDTTTGACINTPITGFGSVNACVSGLSGNKTAITGVAGGYGVTPVYDCSAGIDMSILPTGGAADKKMGSATEVVTVTLELLRNGLAAGTLGTWTQTLSAGAPGIAIPYHYTPDLSNDYGTLSSKGVPAKVKLEFDAKVSGTKPKMSKGKTVLICK